MQYKVTSLIIFLSLGLGRSVVDGFEPNVVHSKKGISFRSISVIDDDTVLVGGSSGTLLRTTNRGKSWTKIEVAADSSALDFRDLESTGQGNVILMSAGPGEKSRIFQSSDGGKTWKERYRNQLADGFFNGMAFWSNGRGLLVGDPIKDRLFLLSTIDFGKTWKPIGGPEMKKGEYGFAASGTGVVTTDPGKVVVATGASAARVLGSSDYGRNWSAKAANVGHGNQSTGIFSIAVHDSGPAVVVGGDYKSPLKDEATYAYRKEANSDWVIGKSKLPHKACVRFLDRKRVVCVGRTGIALSTDSGQTWKAISKESFYTFDIAPKSKTLFMAGADGRIAMLDLGTR